MFTKACLAVLATIAVASNGALAMNHRHAQRHNHDDKRAVVYEATETVTDTTWVTVTIDPNEQTPTTVPAALNAVVTPNPPAPTVVPTTLVTYTSPSSSSSTSAPASTSSASFLTPNAAVAAPNTASGNKRGAAYNAANLVSPLVGSGSHISWAYNWGQVDDGLSSVDSSLEYVPMLWGTRADFLSTWESNAKAAISNGAKHFLGFNEPDNAGQANMDVGSAVAAFIQHLTPHAGSVRLGSPAITNSGTQGEGVSWLKEWVNQCGDSCKHDFCAAHWYSPASSSDFLNFVTQVHEACGGKPVWITEFAPTGADDATIASFLQEVQQALDNQPEYSFVERYAYFFVADGHLINGNSASTYGNTFAYGS